MDAKAWISLGALIISLLAFGYAIYSGAKKSCEKDTKNDQETAIDLATQNIKLDTLITNTNEIRIDQKQISAAVSDLSNRMVRVEEASKSAHKRIDGLEDKR